MNVAETLARHVRERPEAAAIVEGRGSRTRVGTFAELDERSRRAAALLHDMGIQPGQRVLIFQPMSVELYEALLAVFQLGATAMFLDPGVGLEHIERCCAIGKPAALIASWKAHLLRVRSAALRRIPVKLVIGGFMPGARDWNDLRARSPRHEMFAATPDTPALLTFTSGSTGQPKAAVRTHGLLLAQHRAIERSMTLRPGEVDLATLPIFLLANLASGVTSVIPDADMRKPGTIDAPPVLEQIRAHRVTRCTAAPAFLERLLENSARLGALSHLQKVFTGGAPVFPRLIDALARALPHAEVHPVYGSTEAEPIAHFERGEITDADRDAMRDGRGLLAGSPVPEVTLRIVRENWGQPIGPFTATEFAGECLPAGAPGEIVVSGAHVLPGYLDGAGDQETKFRVEGAAWHRTGDAGWLDVRGRLWLLGRASAKIADARGTLWPFAVECAAMQWDAIRSAALVPHEGKRVLVVSLTAGASGACVAGLKEALAWAHLDDVRVVPRIPMDRRHNSKVDYPTLREMLAASSAPSERSVLR